MTTYSGDTPARNSAELEESLPWCGAFNTRLLMPGDRFQDLGFGLPFDVSRQEEGRPPEGQPHDN